LTLVTLFGRPGAGKSTLGDELAARYGFTHFALGAMLKNPDTLREIGIDPRDMAQAVASGRTVTSPTLYPWLDKAIHGNDRVIVDGYPRANISLAPFDALVRSLPANREIFAFVMNCPTEVSHPRLRMRGRADDDERILRRDDEFETVQMPLLAKLPPRVRRVDIDASRPAPQVFEDVQSALGLARLGGWV
jgi:adenylate kinase family enzyme